MKDLFSERLKMLHVESGLSQSEAVAMIEKRTDVKIHQTTFSAMMRGENKPTLPIATALAKAYSVSLDWLTGTTIERKPVAVITEELDTTTAEVKALKRQVAEAKKSNSSTEEISKMLLDLPDAQRERWRAVISAEHQEHLARSENEKQWREVSRLVKLLDSDGSLRSRIESETGISLS